LTPLPLVLTNYSQVLELGMLDRVEQAALATGAMSLGELALWLEALADAEESQTFFATVTMMLVSGRKPRERPIS
jgi:hypothetical protein